MAKKRANKKIDTNTPAENYRTLDILEVISDESILTYEILRLRFPDVDFSTRDDATFFKNAIAFNKSSILNEMLSDKKLFDKDIYDILISDDLIDTDSLIKLEIIRSKQ